MVKWYHKNLIDVSKAYETTPQEDCCSCFNPPVSTVCLPHGISVGGGPIIPYDESTIPIDCPGRPLSDEEAEGDGVLGNIDIVVKSGTSSTSSELPTLEDILGRSATSTPLPTDTQAVPCLLPLKPLISPIHSPHGSADGAPSPQPPNVTTPSNSPPPADQTRRSSRLVEKRKSNSPPTETPSCSGVSVRKSRQSSRIQSTSKEPQGTSCEPTADEPVTPARSNSPTTPPPSPLPNVRHVSRGVPTDTSIIYVSSDTNTSGEGPRRPPLPKRPAVPKRKVKKSLAPQDNDTTWQPPTSRSNNPPPYSPTDPLATLPNPPGYRRSKRPGTDVPMFFFRIPDTDENTSSSGGCNPYVRATRSHSRITVSGANDQQPGCSTDSAPRTNPTTQQSQHPTPKKKGGGLLKKKLKKLFK
ncbi:DNA binding protein motif protein [Ranid herpesvirus 3]|uniref:DNA binding protein motif protein n=1 Tax=Ranid herpesvirus 3 TaxID=1987509 RepID=A0A1X9T566_9VIRU|nr:DNA binding protein motif protein [Ranid herpesvirus 3]ARR28844.1 DNA binding protein motif protein [Ranid herpesvirus 3]